ncbi:MAG: hypothetical protein Q8O64_05725 [Sideroxyarcus sp.]|nr:hypothetical protein [Sideroxyarcus sp.]
MANCYSDGTGLIRLKKITPVIKAIFGAFEVRDYEDGLAFIQQESESSHSTSYGGICEQIGNVDRDDILSSEEVQDVILGFAESFGKRAEVEVLIKDCTFAFDPEEDANLVFLFDLAQILDDDHGMTEISFSAGWHGDRMRLGYFGGFGEVINKDFKCASGSGSAEHLAERMTPAIQRGDVAEIAGILRKRVGVMIDGIADPALREKVREQLLQDTPSSTEVPKP